MCVATLTPKNWTFLSRDQIAAIPENNDVAAAPAKVENREVPGAQGSYLRWFRCA